MSSEKITIHYFPIRGRGEPIRLLLEELGISYTNNDLTYEQWTGPSYKKEWTASDYTLSNVFRSLSSRTKIISAGKAPFGQLPIVQVGETYMAQMEPIMRFFASQHGLYGETPQQKYQCDMICAGIEDWRSIYVDWIYGSKDFEGDKPGYLENAHRFAGFFTQLLKKVEGGAHFFTGSELSFCDLDVWEMLDLQLRVESSFMDKYPELKSFYDRVASRDRIAKYLASGKRHQNANNNGRG